MPGGLSPTVQQFLWERIEGYGELELLLLLHRHPSRFWTAEEAGRETKLPPNHAEEALESLMSKRLVERSTSEPASYHYSGDLAVEGPAQELAHSWEDNRLEIISIMNTHAIARIRNAALKAFSNAFKLRGPAND